jgi:hypothetical protein
MITLLAFVLQVHANLLPNAKNNVQDSMDQLVDQLSTKLFNRLMNSRSISADPRRLTQHSRSTFPFAIPSTPRSPRSLPISSAFNLGFPPFLERLAVHLSSPETVSEREEGARASEMPLSEVHNLESDPVNVFRSAAPADLEDSSVSVPRQSRQLEGGSLAMLHRLDQTFEVPELKDSAVEEFGACSANDQKALDEDGKQFNMGFDCAGSALNIISLNIQQSKLANCLTKQLSISTECSNCFAEGIKYAFNHCKVTCSRNLGDECLTCFAGSNIEGCAEDSAWLGLAWLSVAVQAPLQTRIGHFSQKNIGAEITT